MLEEFRNSQSRSLRHSGGGSGIDHAADESLGGQVLVASGPYGESYPVAGMTVGQVRNRLRDLLDIDPAAQAFVNGNPVGEDTIVVAGQALTFSHHVGQKGLALSAFFCNPVISYYNAT